MGNSHCNCFAGLSHRRGGIARKPEPSPRRFLIGGRSINIDEARAEVIVNQFQQQRSGSWTPSAAWASPVPRKLPVHESRARFDVDDASRRKDVLSRSPLEVEQVLHSPGSLPPPMSPQEREDVIRRLLPTTTSEMLSQLPEAIVEAESEQGQQLRRKLVHGSTVVFFTAGYAGKRFIYERAFELGIKSVIIEHPDSWSRQLVDDGIIAKFVPLDMNRSACQILTDAIEIVKNLGADGVTGEADAVCTFVELSIPVVARICEVLGLPGASTAAIDAARDKHKTRGIMKAAGLPTPKNALIHNEADIKAGAEMVGFPAVLKPISGAASLGVKKVVDFEDLCVSYREVCAELGSLVVVSGALQTKDASNKGVSATNVVDMTVLLEQYLDGPEVDVDMVVSGGEWRYAAVSDNGPTAEPYFNETWAVSPSAIPVQQQRELKELAIKSVEALGFWSGVFHVELKYTSSGPQLIEVNARMGGGPIFETNLQVWGVDLVEETLFCALGIPSRPVVPKKPLTHIAYYLAPCQTSGTVKSLPDIDLLNQDDDVIWVKPLVKIGDRVVGPNDGLPTWVLDFCIKKPSSKEALECILKMEAENRVTV
eukprot:TRINITY_DN1100_c0_g1_i9.p1 TRINITY_DN1100_c0_g1~~TRINITY_DN1100_c0_g1_i9.p1  ORF type:complete len:597 (-),score=98.51 TRINITY_DN1100_c0_g1_i9:216-2006(-)